MRKHGALAPGVNNPSFTNRYTKSQAKSKAAKKARKKNRRS